MSDLISREAAIKAICKHGTDLERRGIMVLAVSNYKQATVDLLESLPSAQPDLQECSVWFHIGETLVDVSKMHITAEEGIEKIRSYLVRMKKPERKVATWKRIDYKPCGHDYECSSCGWKNDMETHFCPNCGARMEGRESRR